MVNKVLLGVLGGIVLLSVAVGGFLGWQLSADTPVEGAEEADDVEEVTPADDGETNASDDGDRNETAASFNASEVDTVAIEDGIVAAVNAGRAESDRDPLSEYDALTEMARFHSAGMADQGYPSHAAAGYDTVERYEEFDLYDQCRVPDDTRSGVREGRELETITRVTLNTTEAPDEREVAKTVATQWAADEEARTKLTYRYASRLGVGVEVTDSGYVYATLDLC
ncbi:CAP domain-containing protein [Halomarina ordinaria]|uniref:CAP domain-containing protein n=1 Tax=Halomarina ordinaria TaxID=3033939 RepID=A0ABD5U633_9EURY|nr:CAP domain-containing protein [Halomarina sp. PSRA2]